MTTLTAGVTLNATASIRDGQTTYTREQVAYLVALAYESGRAHAVTEDMAEVAACWAEFAEPRLSREQRVTARLAEMAAGVEREARRPRDRTHAAIYEVMEWPDVAVPGEVDVTALQSVWSCPCPRNRHGGHITPKNPDHWSVMPKVTVVNRRRHLALVGQAERGAA
ncbi:hypothetical protein ABNF97_09340 [Plantactinospora sp. B6F1]|uniref:hypothetical protein n=1 Tax=Plantactinospora sp. B6F1 TaxID=3158971 RepID=UPI0032D94123